MRKRLRILLLGWVCLVLGPGSSRVQAEIPNALRGQRIVAVRVPGESAQNAGPELTGVRLGERLDRSVVRAAIEHLMASGRWVDVQVDVQAAGSGVVLVFHLDPRITLRRVEIRGVEQLDEQVARDALALQAGADTSADALPTLSAAVRKAYAERGYLGTRVAVGFRDTDDPAQKVLLVEIDEGWPARIAKLTFSGAQPPQPERVLSAMGLGIGDVLNRHGLASAILQGERQLRADSYLEAHIGSPVVTFNGQHAELSFPTHVGPRYTLEVDGASPLLDRDIAASVLLIDVPLTAEAIDAMPARIKDVYAKNGFANARAEVSRTLLSPKRARLRARIAPGMQLEIVGVSFAGAQHYSPEFLREQLDSYLDEDLPGGELVETVDSEVAAEVLHGPPLAKGREVPRPQEQAPTRTYYEPTYREALKHISELYQADGFLSVRVGPPALQALDPRRATVDIPIFEGPRTLLYGVVLTGQQQVGSRELLLASGLLRGAPFSYLLLEEARVHMQALYQERGHMFVRIEPSVRFSNDRTRAEVSFQIVEGFPVRVGEIVVRGADRTSIDFIRSLVTLKRGDLFRPSQARDSERALSSLGVMTGISVQLEDPDLPARVKRLLVLVSERRNQFLDFSAGVSTGQGARAGFDYGYRNLFGHGVGLTLRVQFAYQLLFVRSDLRARFEKLLFSERLERNVALGIVVPRLPGLGSTRTNLDIVHVRDNERDFGLDKNGMTLAFTETPIRRVTLLEAADLENNNIDLFAGQALDDLVRMTTDPRVKRLLRVPEGNTTLAAMRSSITFDARDSPFVPTRGYFVSASSELASTLSSDSGMGEHFLSRFMKLQFTGNGYIPLGKSVVLAGQLRLGRIVHLVKASRTYPNRAFFLGGVDTMRGFLPDEMIPQDLIDLASRERNENEAIAAVRSGDAFVLLRGEVRFPIYGQLGGGLFADLGNLWRDPANMNPFDLRPNAGAGLRLNTPVGPIAVDYGIVLARRTSFGEPFGTLQFSIGLF
jgi:outer membrane protein insertion porin family